jgi:release factor glutamine methyltransferase
LTIISEVLEVDRIYIILNGDRKLTETEIKRVKEFFQRREQHEPLEYILQKVSFYSEIFFIDKGALIPRPETELLIDEVLKIAKNRDKILEIGIGSGIISIILAKKLPESKILGVDISKDALKIAEKNIKLHNITNIELRESNLFSNVKEKFDIIISNPPYISDSEKGKLQKELDFEPENSLYGGQFGDEVLIEIINNFFKFRTEKWLFCEIGYNQKDIIINIVKNRGKVQFYKDLSNFYRGFSLIRSDTI